MATSEYGGTIRRTTKLEIYDVPRYRKAID